MGKYYSQIKDNIKLMKEFESSGTDEESTQAMKALRPKTSFKFKEYLAKESERRKKMMYHNKNYSSVAKRLQQMSALRSEDMNRS